MRYKSGVYTEVMVWIGGYLIRRTMAPELQSIINVVDNICRAVGGVEGTITAVFDGKHKSGSKHYIGDAFDLRIRHLNQLQKLELFELIKNKLGKKFDVVLHSTHIHIEYDPK